MIRSKNDVVLAYSMHVHLMNRIFNLLRIYSETKYIDIPKFRLLRLAKLEETRLLVDLLTISKTEHTRSRDIIDPAACPTFGIGWEPSGEDIIGTEQVYDHTSYGLDVVGSFWIPMDDLAVMDDDFLPEVRNRYVARVAERDKKIARERLQWVRKQTAERLSEIDKQLSDF